MSLLVVEKGTGVSIRASALITSVTKDNTGIRYNEIMKD